MWKYTTFKSIKAAQSLGRRRVAAGSIKKHFVQPLQVDDWPRRESQDRECELAWEREEDLEVLGALGDRWETRLGIIARRNRRINEKSTSQIKRWIKLNQISNCCRKLTMISGIESSQHLQTRKQSDYRDNGKDRPAEAEEQGRRKRRAEEPSSLLPCYNLSGHNMLMCGLRDSYIHLSVDQDDNRKNLKVWVHNGIPFFYINILRFCGWGGWNGPPAK